MTERFREKVHSEEQTPLVVRRYARLGGWFGSSEHDTRIEDQISIPARAKLYGGRDPKRGGLLNSFRIQLWASPPMSHRLDRPNLEKQSYGRCTQVYGNMINVDN